MRWVEAYSTTGAPSGAISLGNDMYGMWFSGSQETLITWISQSPERFKASVYDRSSPDLPDYAIAELADVLTVAGLQAATDMELERLTLAFFKFADSGFTQARVDALRAEYKRRFGV